MARGTHPAGGIDYPRTSNELGRWFLTEEACWSYLRKIRWGDGFRCPACGWDQAWLTSRSQFRCASCQRQTSVTAGTIFEGTRKPLRTWFDAIWYVTNQKHGVSGLGLQRALGLGSYQTAWTWLHKLRRAMVRPGRDRLGGIVEVDETYVGHGKDGVGGRHARTKPIVAIAVEVHPPKGLGRIRMRRIPDVSASSLTRFVCEVVEPGTTVRTDGWVGYNGLPARGYIREKTVMLGSDEPAHVVLPAVHRVASLLKRWLLGTHHGSVQESHLDYYLDEFTFRFNRRTSRSRGLLFYRLIQQALQIEPVPYRLITGSTDQANHKM